MPIRFLPSVILDASDACNVVNFAFSGTATRAWDIKGTKMGFNAYLSTF